MKAFANGIAINYSLEGSDPALVLIHALGLDLRQWRWQVPQLALGHQVLRYDVRGHGRSDVTPGPYTLDLFAEDLRGLLDALGIRRASVLGLSMGGMIAQAFTLTYPSMVDKLILADTTSEYGPDARRVFEERAKDVLTHGMDAVVDGAIERWFAPEYRQAEPGVVDEIRSIFRRSDPVGYAQSCLAIAGLDLTRWLKGIRCPTLVLVGEKDPGTPVEVAAQLHRAISGSRLEVIRGASHLSNVSHAEVFNDLVRGFLAE